MNPRAFVRELAQAAVREIDREIQPFTSDANMLAAREAIENQMGTLILSIFRELQRGVGELVRGL